MTCIRPHNLCVPALSSVFSVVTGADMHLNKRSPVKGYGITCQLSAGVQSRD